jgi:hypothetical protein
LRARGAGSLEVVDLTVYEIPEVSAGAVAHSSVSEMIVTSVAGVRAAVVGCTKLTVVFASGERSKPVPVTSRTQPPPNGPLVGVKPVTVVAAYAGAARPSTIRATPTPTPATVDRCVAYPHSVRGRD